MIFRYKQNKNLNNAVFNFSYLAIAKALNYDN